MLKREKGAINIISPFFIFIFVSLFQFFLWYFLYPKTPYLGYAHSRENDVGALLCFLLYAIFFIFGMFIANTRIKTHPDKRNILIYKKYYHYCIMVLLAMVWFSQWGQISGLSLKSTMTAFSTLSPYNLIHKNLLSSKIPFSMAINTLKYLLYAFLAMVICEGVSKKTKKVYGFMLLITLSIDIAITFLLGARAELAMSIMVIFVFFARDGIGSKKAIGAILILASIFWTMDYYKTGIPYERIIQGERNIWETNRFMVTQFVEKYIPGEFNQSLILMKEKSRFPFSIMYATPFKIAGYSEPPDTPFLNTLHSFAYWEWEFGVFGLIVAFFFGYLVNKSYIYFNCISGITTKRLYYPICFIALVHMVRFNSFLSLPFLIPITTILIIRVVEKMLWVAKVAIVGKE